MNTSAPDIFDPADFVFITMFTYRKRKVFVNDGVCEILCEAMSFHIAEGNVEIAGFVIMPEHVHIILRPDGMAAHQFVNNFKSYTGIKVKETAGFKGKVWRQRFFDEPIEDAEGFAARLVLMHFNPVKKEYAVKPGDYRWSSYGSYYGGEYDVPVFKAPVK